MPKIVWETFKVCDTELLVANHYNMPGHFIVTRAANRQAVGIFDDVGNVAFPLGSKDLINAVQGFIRERATKEKDND